MAIGVIVSLPFAWLLSYAAALPYFLGLFFFVLFGLVIGAAMHRVASSGRPYGYTTLVAGTTVVVLVGWMMSVVTEGRGFSSDMAMKAGQSTRRRIPDIEAYRAAVAADVDRFLRERYPPGGSIGYVRWILTSGELEKGEIAGVDRTLRRGPRRGWWAVRVVLSLGLLAFGIGSQTLPLTSATEHAVRAIDERKV